MDNKEKQNEEHNVEEGKFNAGESNPFFGSPQDRPPAAPEEHDIEMQQEKEEPAKESKLKFFGKDKVKKLEKENKELLEKLEKLNSQYLRLAADFDNFRKRQDQERQDIFYSSLSDAVKNLLPTLDTLDKAYLSFRELDDVDKLKESFNVLYRQMQESMNRLQVVKIKTAGELFDPNYHEAVMQEETTDYPDNAIMMELQPGYMAAGRVVRPSMVKVASNPSADLSGSPVSEVSLEENVDQLDG